MTASSGINSHTDLNRIDQTRGNINVKGGDLLVNEKNIDRQTHTHHRQAWIRYLIYVHKTLIVSITPKILKLDTKLSFVSFFGQSCTFLDKFLSFLSLVAATQQSFFFQFKWKLYQQSLESVQWI